MKVLFISSGNSRNGISSITKNQGISLSKIEVDIDYYTIKGKGLLGYCRTIFTLRNYIKNNKYDIFHAHYSLSAIVAALAGCRPLVVSLMGSDVKAMKTYKLIIKLYEYIFWKKTIVKSLDMKRSLGINNVEIIPNGVDFDHFKPLSKHDCQGELKWDTNLKHILFAADPSRHEKNYKLAQDSFELIQDGTIELHYLVDVANVKMPIWYNASDVIILTSIYEGSPNVIKEAMACNVPIVSTDVGDVQQIIGDTDGCYICSYEPEDVAYKIKNALAFGKHTDGRKNIQHLDSKKIVEKIVSIYNSIL